MGFIKWIFGKKENISSSAIEHSSKGDYQPNGRIAGGGHGEECIKHLKENEIDFNILKTYKNGVRVGNIPSHKKPKKRSGLTQTWFPKSWKRDTIKKAGQVVARGHKYPDGKVKSGHYSNVNIGIIRTNGKVSTIFPMSIQKNKKGIEMHEQRKTCRTNRKK